MVNTTDTAATENTPTEVDTENAQSIMRHLKAGHSRYRESPAAHLMQGIHRRHGDAGLAGFLNRLQQKDFQFTEFERFVLKFAPRIELNHVAPSNITFSRREAFVGFALGFGTAKALAKVHHKLTDSDKDHSLIAGAVGGTTFLGIYTLNHLGSLLANRMRDETIGQVVQTLDECIAQERLYGPSASDAVQR